MCKFISCVVLGTPLNYDILCCLGAIIGLSRTGPDQHLSLNRNYYVFICIREPAQGPLWRNKMASLMVST